MHIYPKEISTQVLKGTCSRTFIGTFAIKKTNGTKIEIFVFGGRNRKQHRCLLLGEWMGKTQQIHIKTHSATIRNNKFSASIATWAEFKGLMLIEKS